MRLVALGGLGEFGANALLLDDGAGSRVLVDAGAAFSDLEPFGVAYEVPDFGALGESLPQHVILTHGHDDHAKGLWLLREAAPEAAVWGSRVTLARAGAASVDGVEAEVRELTGDRPVRLGSFEVDALPVSHSIPGTLALRVSGPAGRLVVATDLRLATSALGEATPADRLAAWGADGVGVLLLDSTNALVEQAPPDEGTVGETLAELVRTARGAVVAVTFASHLGRVRQLAMAALHAGRVAVPVGRGLVESLRLQAMEGGLGLPPGLLRPARELPELPRDRLLLIATGSQGEPGSAFSRLAVDVLSGFQLAPGDLVLHAARAIPGSERRLAHYFDHCVRRGAHVVTAAEAPIHASGHPHRAELARLLDLLAPAWVVPVHGRRRNLAAVAELAARHGTRALLVENGEEVTWRGAMVEATGEKRGVGRVLLADVGEEVLDPATLRHRRIMAQEGMVVAVLCCARGGDGPPAPPQLHTHGLELDGATLASLATGLAAEIGRGTPVARHDPDWLRSTMTAWLRSELRRRTRRRPAVVALVMEQ